MQNFGYCFSYRVRASQDFFLSRWYPVPLGWGRVCRPRNMPLSNMCYHVERNRFKSNYLSVNRVPIFFFLGGGGRDRAPSL